MNETIRGDPTGETIDVKRFYLPGVVLTAQCPACGASCEKDYGGCDYLSFPVMGSPFDLGLYCRSCDHEWSVPAKLTVRLELLPTGTPRTN